ncbi:caspase family protein [Prosthecodimorpha staleyi]|uniref:Caspase family protein n=1 Tax=Prosthecodimorpha staleyi TaxID=2840188 RepID=A0A947D9K3_9HYPH|nr:caspase family protein [Prosthecodimorpha staleyi]MBT9290647.1 caspase family protein [Prosthecodimorpha staleyi]
MVAGLLRSTAASLVLVVAALWPCADARAAARVALLIGNADYPAAPLSNPTRDVDAMEASLREAGFDTVIAHKNLDLRAMDAAIEEFREKVQGAEIAVLYYSGHGIEVNGTNYLVPRDARLMSETAARREAIALDDALEALEGATRLRLVLLDACRDNPFVARMKRTKGALTRGLRRTDPGRSNTLIAYATAPGTVAYDGDGGLSPFTASLVHHLVTPGLDVEYALRRVHDDVVAATRPIAARSGGDPQEPYKTGSLGSDLIALSRKPVETGGAGTPPSGAGRADQRADYDEARRIGTAEAWQLFLTHHPTGFLADLARIEAKRLAGRTAALPPAAAAATVPERRPPPAATMMAPPKPADVGAPASATELIERARDRRPVTALALSPNGRLLAAATDAGLTLWDGPSGRLVRAISGHKGPVNAVSFAPAGLSIVSGSGDRSLRLWDTGSGQSLWTHTIAREWTYAIYAVAVSPDGQTVAYGGTGNVLALVNAATGQAQKTLGTFDDAVRAIAFAPDGRTVAAAGKSLVKIWDPASGLQTLALSHPERVRAIAFAPDGRRLAAGLDSGDIQIWELPGGKALQRLTGHSGSVRALAFAPDGRTLASGSSDLSVRLWDPELGAEIWRDRSHADTVTSLIFARDGRRVITGGLDGTIRWRDAASGKVAAVSAEDGRGHWMTATSGDRFVTDNPLDWLRTTREKIDPALETYLSAAQRPSVEMSGPATP